MYRRPHLLSALTLSFVLALLIGCQATPQKAVQPSPEDTVKTPAPVIETIKEDHQDSTLFFSRRRASVSLRATLSVDPATPGLTKGYQLQFRSAQAKTVQLENIAITSGGKRIAIENGVLFLPSGKGLTFELSLSDSQFLDSQGQALLLFVYDGQTHIARISNHRLIDFLTEEN